jgi:hypothetical protein
MAINIRNRFHLALHMAWSARGGPSPWVCDLLMWLGATDCRKFTKRT